MKYLSLFSGIGGFEYGLQQSNGEFECVGFSEIDKYAKQIYKRHFPNHIDLGDASKIRAEEIEDFDLLVGGFPCQAFSLAGHRKGFDDTRGTLFFEIARICKEKKPRYLLLENVKGLLSHNKGRTFKKILGVLAELGYDVEWQVLNSKSFGVAQNRERVYIKGYFRAKCGGEILSQKRDCSKTDTRLGEIKKVGNLSNTGHGGKNVYSETGISPTLCSDSIPKNGVNILLDDNPKLKPFVFNRQVKKRVYDCDYDELCGFLRKYKKAAKATLTSISETLDVPRSEVDHWFRKDKYFAPPPSEYWMRLKKLLNIDDDRFDDFIMTWEYVDGVYDMDKRAYDETGLGPTLTTRDESLIKVVDNTSPSGHWGDDVFDVTGVSRAITRSNHKHPLKVKVAGNLSNTGHNGENVLETSGVSSTLTANNFKHPLKVLEEDTDIEKVYNTTREFNKCDTDGSHVPCLTASMGTGGGNVPMMKLKTNTKKGYDEVTAGDGVRLCHPSSTKARGRSQKDMTGALSTQADWGTVDRDYRIRKLTPLECERLQAFPDYWTKYGADGEEISDTQRYKCLGNAVTTSVVTYLANTMFGDGVEEKG